jgi:hypothetical protein
MKLQHSSKHADSWEQFPQIIGQYRAKPHAYNYLFNFSPLLKSKWSINENCTSNR